MNRNLISRIVTCVVGVPAILAVIFLLPQYNYLVLSLVMTFFTIIGSYEMSNLVFGRKEAFSFLPGLLPLMQYIQNVIASNLPLCETALVLLLFLSFAIEIFKGAKDNFKGTISRCAKYSLIILYPGYLASFVIRLTGLSYSNSSVISLFLLLVFGNDIFAYIFGMLFGRNNAGIIKASPKKSIAGFIGGTIGCVSLCILWFAVFSSKLPDFLLFEKIILAIFISISANIGDLVESIFKRSAGIKDSGNIIPGRGGVLDSVDSILSSAPVFFILLEAMS